MIDPKAIRKRAERVRAQSATPHDSDTSSAEQTYALAADVLALLDEREMHLGTIRHLTDRYDWDGPDCAHATPAPDHCVECAIDVARQASHG